jgi:pilus assembly protein Flp/PilA
MFEQMGMALRLTATWVTSRLNVKSERGATAVEYGLMVALIAAVIIGAVVVLGNNAKTSFQCTADSVSSKLNKC